MFVNLTDSQQAVPHLEIKERDKEKAKRRNCPYFIALLLSYAAWVAVRTVSCFSTCWGINNDVWWWLSSQSCSGINSRWGSQSFPKNGTKAKKQIQTNVFSSWFISNKKKYKKTEVIFRALPMIGTCIYRLHLR